MGKMILGAQTTGKSKVCNEILEKLESAPFHCYTETFFCAQNKGRKVMLEILLARCPF